jgi:hypothetical protein
LASGRLGLESRRALSGRPAPVILRCREVVRSCPMPLGQCPSQCQTPGDGRDRRAGQGAVQAGTPPHRNGAASRPGAHGSASPSRPTDGPARARPCKSTPARRRPASAIAPRSRIAEQSSRISPRFHPGPLGQPIEQLSHVGQHLLAAAHKGRKQQPPLTLKPRAEHVRPEDLTELRPYRNKRGARSTGRRPGFRSA